MKSISLKLACTVAAMAAIFSSSCKKDGGNTAGAIELCEVGTGETRLKNHNNGLDYIITCNITMYSGKLVIEPGVSIKVKSGYSIFIEDQASIEINGSEAERVTFEPFENEGLPSWGGIAIRNNNAANKINYTSFNYGGSEEINPFFQGNSTVSISGRCSMTGVTVRNSGGSGIFIDAGSNLPVFSSVLVEGSENYALQIDRILVKNLQPGSFSASGNGLNKIEVRNTSTLTGSHVWNNLGVPFMVAENFEIADGNLELREGVVIEVETDKRIAVFDNGSLKISGTLASPVILRGKEAIPGWWQGVTIQNTNPLNVWNNVEIAHGGSSPVTFSSNTSSLNLGGYLGASTKLTVTNMLIRDGEGCGILESGSSIDFTSTNVTFSNVDNNECTE